ncbi:hypothetical protein BGW41_007858 [Actinomortierella wolfii]|nr:hypothetical protein BGW41_007858 [Actinomortierella wolfii]
MGWLNLLGSIGSAIIGVTPDIIDTVNSTPDSRPEEPEPPSWMPGQFYPRGKIIKYNGVNFICYQDHVAHGHDWTPPNFPAYWKAL